MLIDEKEKLDRIISEKETDLENINKNKQKAKKIIETL
jgi:hypothetical protein